MAERPAVNPNVDDIADRAKHGYATGTKLLAEMQYRLAELAGTGRLDPDESMSLQDELVRLWEALYFGTLCAVRDENTPDCTWDEADNTYSDGREVMIQIRVEPYESSECSWEHNGFTVGDGAVNEHPRERSATSPRSIPRMIESSAIRQKSCLPTILTPCAECYRRSTAPMKRTPLKVMGRTWFAMRPPPPKASTPCAPSRTTRSKTDDR